MIVVHPKDPSTRFLHLIYEDIEGVLFFDSISQREQILEAIKAAPKDEFILLLGHGTPYGLFGGFIGDEDAELLKDRPNLVGIWCYASTFARRHNLKGFFSGMFISEWYEAADMGVDASDDEIVEMCWNFAGMFGDLLRAGYPLETIAADLMNMNNIKSDLSYFNFIRLTYRGTGMESLPVKEDYLGYDHWDEEQDNDIVLRGIDSIRREVEKTIWEGIPFNLELTATKVEKVCLRLVFEKAFQEKGKKRPSLKELAQYLRQAGVKFEKRRKGVIWKPYYIVHMPGLDYLFGHAKGTKGVCLGTGVFPDSHSDLVSIEISPSDSLSTLYYYHYKIRPMIRSMLLEFYKDTKKRMKVNEIRSVTMDNCL